MFRVAQTFFVYKFFALLGNIRRSLINHVIIFYKVLNKTKSFIKYIKIISFIIYIFVFKKIRKETFNKKYKKRILVGFKSSNNYLVYIQKK